MEDRLKELFIQGGVSSYQAALETGYDPKTVKEKFKNWSKELVGEQDRESWFEREKRVRQRALEGLSFKLLQVRNKLKVYNKLLAVSFGLSEDDFKSKDIEKRIDTTKLTAADHEKIELYEKIVRLNTILESELQQQYDVLEMTPPSEEVLLMEVEKLIATKAITNKNTE